MSVVTLQVGQCGNQIGRQLFATLRQDVQATVRPGESCGGSAYLETSTERFFVAHDRGRRSGSRTFAASARAVLVDMEPKVVQQSLHEADGSGEWRYDPKCVYAEKRGSGNNWAKGFHQHGPRAADRVMDMLQSQAEKCDHLSAFLVLMSVAGGTGAGVGSYLTECLKDRYPHVAVVNQLTWPYFAGEVIVQNYNALLTFAHLQQSSDAILLLQNDQLHKACSKLLHLKNISFSDINSVICHCLASILQPSVQQNHFGSKRMEDRLLYDQCCLQDIVTQLCPLQDYKILSLKSVPQMPEKFHQYSQYLWAGLLKHLRQMLVTDAHIEEGMNWSVSVENREPRKPIYSYQKSEPTSKILYTPTGANRSLANLVVARGNEVETADVSPFMDAGLYSQSSPLETTCQVWVSGHCFNKYDKSCTLLSNSQSCILPLEMSCSKAWQMYTSRAYIYQYLQNGLSNQDFLDCFAWTEQTLKAYATI